MRAQSDDSAERWSSFAAALDQRVGLTDKGNSWLCRRFR